MPYRPYPNADRARRQVARHVHEPVPVSVKQIAMAEWAALVIANAQTAMRPFAEMMETVRAQAARPHALYDPRSGRFELVAEAGP